MPARLEQLFRNIFGTFDARSALLDGERRFLWSNKKMRKLILAAAAVAAFGLILPVATPSASAQTLVVRSGHGPHRHVVRDHRRVVVVKPVRRGDSWRHSHRHGHVHGTRVIVR
jgi:hypothetical protein